MEQPRTERQSPELTAQEPRAWVSTRISTPQHAAGAPPARILAPETSPSGASLRSKTNCDEDIKAGKGKLDMRQVTEREDDARHQYVASVFLQLALVPWFFSSSLLILSHSLVTRGRYNNRQQKREQRVQYKLYTRGI